MANSEKEVVITYETLFELLRIEKSRPELQKLSNTFYTDALGYIKEKLSILNDDAPQTSLFASAEKEKTRRELENIGRILKELYDRREKKLLEMAMIKSRTNTGIIDTSNLLSTEKALFETITNDLKLYRSASLMKLLGGQEPTTVDKCAEEKKSDESMPEIPSATSSSEGDAVSVSYPEPAQSAENPNLYKEESSQPTQQIAGSSPTVRFLAAVDEIVGPDLQIYGPYETGTTAELPKELAQALINNKQAEPLQ